MKIYLDSADVVIIDKYMNEYGLDGFTCNPTICARQMVNLDDLLRLGNLTTSFFQVISVSCDGMVIDAREILSKNPNAIIKVPVTREGLKAIKILTRDGVKVLATAIYTVSQAIMAMKAGAQYIAPYVNRISDNGADGVEVVSDMLDIIKRQNLKCEIVAASFKNISQVTSLIQLGVHSVTVPIDIFEKLIHSELAEVTVSQFTNDWFKAYNRYKF